jgi:hypothetical protein
MPAGADAQLRRLERTALAACGGLAVVAAVAGGGRALLGVIGGAAVVAVSYRAIRAGVNALTASAVERTLPSRSVSKAWGLVKFITRFAILGAIAYVMMVRLRAHPGWMLAGASSLVAAAAFEAVRGLRRARPGT